MKQLLLLLGLVFATQVCAQTADFARGADVSWCTEMESDGKVFRNSEGVETELFALMKQIGMTAIRLRVWVNPQQFGYGAWCDKADVVAKAKRAHAQGLDLMIDFHYSDFFADPGTQTTPQDWKDYSLEQLKTAMADYTKDVLQTLKEEGIEPRWVQVGNETNSGMLHPLGKLDWNQSSTTRYNDYVALSNTGYDAVKEVLPQAQVIIHIGGTENADWFFQDIKAAGAKFDMIGLSHYPTSGEWNSSSASATHSNINAAKWVSAAAEKFGVPVMICETGYESWQPEKASEVMHDLMNRMKGISQCAGVFYWEPEVDGVWKPAYYTEVGWGAYGMGAFSTEGRPTAALDAFGNESTDISTLPADDDQPATWYDLQGRRNSYPTKGVMIVRQGYLIQKIIIK